MSDIFNKNLTDESPSEIAKTLLDTIPSAVFTVSNEGKITSWNKRAESILGYASSEILGVDCHILFMEPCGENLGILSSSIKKPVIGKIFTVKNKQGDVLIISKNVDLLRDIEGNINGRIETFEDITDRIRDEENCKNSIAYRDSLVSALHDLIYVIDKNGLICDYVTGDDEDLNLPKDMVINKNITDIFPEEMAAKIKDGVEKVLDKEPIEAIEYQMSIKKQVVFYECKLFTLDDSKVVAVIRSISKRKRAESDLKESEERFRTMITQMQQGFAVHEVLVDKTGKVIDYRFLDVNEGFERLTGLKHKNIIGKTIIEILPEAEMEWIEKYGHVALTGEPLRYNNYSKDKDKYFETFIYSPKHMQFAVVITDITERKKMEKENYYLIYHDQLTGLYNRKFHEEELKRIDKRRNLPITIAMFDVNGLKLINDSFGHTMGDELLRKVAEMIKKWCRTDDIIARLGGDEFIVILPKTNSDKANQMIKRIMNLSLQEKFCSMDISISFGYDTKYKEEDSIEEVYKNAEDKMYRHKLSVGASIRNKTINIILNTLYEKNKREMMHSKRVSEICGKLAIEMGLDTDSVNELKTAGLMHDIGKIGIDENILNKPQKLTREEWSEIERHSEKGYRILSSVNEFSEIAEYVLEHHEKWDGNGYPRGLKGEEISLQARIIAIADAFDAITNERTYSVSMSDQEAVSIIRRGAGVHFDPGIARIFIEKVLKKKWNEYPEDEIEVGVKNRGADLQFNSNL